MHYAARAADNLTTITMSESYARFQSGLLISRRLLTSFPPITGDSKSCLYCLRVLHRTTQVRDRERLPGILQGLFVHDGPQNYEIAFQGDQKPIPGVLEEEVKAELLKEFGGVLRQCHCSTLLIFLGIDTLGFKSYYSNAYY